MTQTTQYVTQENLDKMKEALQKMKSVDRPAAAKAIAEAREKGDLKENAEYDAAKNHQGMLEARIKQLENSIANSRVLDEASINTEKVSILTRVTITNTKTKQQLTYQIVSENEADVKQAKISSTSLVGKALLGKHVNDIVTIDTPSGIMTFCINKITL